MSQSIATSIVLSNSHGGEGRIDCPPKAKKKRWSIPSSKVSKLSLNPVRAVVERIAVQPNPSLPLIRLSIGDPSIFGNLPPCPSSVEAVLGALRCGESNSLESVCGSAAARRAVAEMYSTPGHRVRSEDVVVTSGCATAIELFVRAFTGPGDNILMPRPAYSIIRCHADPQGVECRTYDLVPTRNWEADLKDLESKIDSNTKFILLINPSNPCGSVFSDRHLRELMAVAAHHRVAVVADEIYEHMTFTRGTFGSATDINEDVPVIKCGGIGKRYLVPGWRLGWLVVFDRRRVLEKAGVLEALQLLSHSVGSTCTVIQAALHSLLHRTPPHFYSSTMDSVQASAGVIQEKLSSIPSLSPISPQGAMYLMVGLDVARFRDVGSDVEFTEKLLAEQSVFVLPGKCFQYPNFFRLTVMMPSDVIGEACERIRTFCHQHSI